MNESGDVVQRDGYYPFGLAFNSYTSGTKNNYLYNQGFGETTFQGEEGKVFRGERQQELDIDLTKYRAYDYTTGRFWQIDPLADKAGQEVLTPYHYTQNNPVRWNDPYGDCFNGKPCLQSLKDIGEGFVAIGEATGINSAGRAIASTASNIGEGFSQLASSGTQNVMTFLEYIDGSFSGDEPDTRGSGDVTNFKGETFVKTSGTLGSQGIQGKPSTEMDVTVLANVKSPGSVGTTGSGAPGGLEAGAELVKDVAGTVSQLIDIVQSSGGAVIFGYKQHRRFQKR